MDLKDDALKIQAELKKKGITVTCEQVQDKLQLFAKFKVTGDEAKRGVIHVIEEATGVSHKKRKIRWISKEAELEYLRKEAYDETGDNTYSMCSFCSLMSKCVGSDKERCPNWRQCYDYYSWSRERSERERYDRMLDDDEDYEL